MNKLPKAFVEALIANQQKELRTLDYKLKFPGTDDADKKEFLYDVSSFANASGGDLVFGVSEKRDTNGKTTGLPEKALGLSTGNISAEVSRLESLIQSSIQPRIPRVHFYEVEGFEAGSVVVVRIQRSPLMPHMVTLKGAQRFYSRNSATGKYPLDVIELRSAFVMSDSWAERVQEFCRTRIAKIISQETPIQTSPPLIAVHAIPLSYNDPYNRHDVTLLANQSWLELQPMSSASLSKRINIDGLLTYTSSEHATNNYVQVFRGGAVESVNTRVVFGRPEFPDTLPSYAVERDIIGATTTALRFQQKAGIPLPILVWVTLVGVKGKCLATQTFYATPPFDRDLVALPELVLEEYPLDVSRVLRPTFDAMYQAAGEERCPNYDDDGKWNHPAGRVGIR